MKLLDGKLVSEQLLTQLKQEIIDKNLQPKLVVIQVGNDLASSVYVRNKQKTAEKIGIQSETIQADETITQDELMSLVNKYNEDDTVNGILVQLPLPSHIDERKILESIHPSKDVDGFHPLNVGKLNIGQQEMIPSTPAGIMGLLKYYNIPIKGKHVVIVGRSNIVGKPLAHLLLNEHATVTIAHSQTENLKALTKQADILVVAVGRAGMITADYVKDNAVVIDVGINRTKNGLKGDVNFNDVKSKVAFITPVPGGVGPMTITMLMSQTIKATKMQKKIT